MEILSVTASLGTVIVVHGCDIRKHSWMHVINRVQNLDVSW